MVRCSIMRLEHCRIELGPLHAVFIALSFGLCFLKGCWCLSICTLADKMVSHFGTKCSICH
uniref:Putative ovule protein n=1 Tax=Solanum chacoense TaxID=4108 RepID=A0A0V0GWK8_SOLCH